MILAEISDKVVSCWELFLLSALIAAIAGWVSAARWWFGPILLVPKIAFMNYVCWSELQEVPYGQLLLSEMGWGWVVGQYVAINTPPVTAAFIFRHMQVRQRRARRLKRGQCEHCGYAAIGMSLCPECGTARKSPQPTP